MLKWAVYKKNHEAQAAVNPQSVAPDINSNRFYNDKSRRYLDAQVVRRSKKTNRYQRRSIGATTRRNNTKSIDKENINFIGNTPDYYKAGFVENIEKIILKDVSNITPTSATPLKKFEKFLFYCDDENDVPPELPPTTASYSRRVREAKKIKLEMHSSNNSEVLMRNSFVYKYVRRIQNIDCSLLSPPNLSHSTSELTLNELSNRLSANTTSRKSTRLLEDYRNKNKPVCSTKTSSKGTVEIEYDKDLIINCLEKPFVVKQNKKSTLPIFGNNIFADNPLYLKKNEDVSISIRPSKRTRKKTNDFEISFKSPSIDKSDAHSLGRDACSPVSLMSAVKLEALRLSVMSTHDSNAPDVIINDVCQYFPKSDNHFDLTMADEDTFTEMENKFMLSMESLMSSTESTISTTQMRDMTLDQMIEDIIKSTKIVKCKRRSINNKVDTKATVKEETPNREAFKDLFIKPQAVNNFNLLKEARHVNLSRESPVSPNNIFSKKKMPNDKLDEKLSKNSLNGCFLLNDKNGYIEKKVQMPHNLVCTETVIKNYADIKLLSKSHSMNVTCTIRNNLEHKLSESTSDLYNTLQENNVKVSRQKGERKKKSTTSRDSLTKQIQMKTNSSKTSLLRTLEMGIPSPALDLQNVTLCEPFNSPFQTYQPTSGKNKDLHNTTPDRNNLVCSSLMFYKPISIRNIRSKPSQTKPDVNLKHTSKKLSENRAGKTSNLEENLIPNDAVTPVIEFKTCKRYLEYSPEEISINSKSAEKCKSIANNRLEQSDRHQALKATIELEIESKHDQSLAFESSRFQKTFVLDGKKEPELQWHLKLPLPTAV